MYLLWISDYAYNYAICKKKRKKKYIMLLILELIIDYIIIKNLKYFFTLFFK